MLKAMYFQKNSSRFIVKIVFIMTSLSFYFKRYHVLSMKRDIQLCQKRIDIPFRITHTISAIRAITIYFNKYNMSKRMLLKRKGFYLFSH